MRRITWFVNEMEDVEVYLGTLDVKELNHTPYIQYYLSGSPANQFFEHIGLYPEKVEIGDWGNASLKEVNLDEWKNCKKSIVLFIKGLTVFI